MYIDLSTFARPDFFQTMSSFDQWQFWQFTIINIAFFGLPPLIQRTYAAQNIGSLKLAYAVLLFGVWLAIMVGIYLGIMAVQIFGPGFYPVSPFNAIIEKVMVCTFCGFQMEQVTLLAHENLLHSKGYWRICQGHCRRRCDCLFGGCHEYGRLSHHFGFPVGHVGNDFAMGTQ